MTSRKSIFGWLGMLYCLCLMTLPVQAADDADAKSEKEFLKKLNWTNGPAKADLKSYAQVNVPEGFMFADAKSTQKLLEAMGNPTSGAELGMLTPTNLSWFVVFEFSDDGYVKDDDKDKLDADKMLKAITEGNERANEQRKKMGAAPLKITGWQLPPRYNEKTHNLEWAIKGESDGEQVINWNTRLLGRHGIMEVSLVVDPGKMQATMPEYQKVLADYTFKAGETYAEYRQGDKVAKYGLAALVVGGAAVGAAKLGLFTWLLLALKKAWKLVAVACAAVASWVKKLFGRKSESAE